ncbi:magnesium transporter CorA family protein [Blastococcus sp. Marseille-P5729]|uniref:magnesium transporter CorA family protein n=1 Tax=Blastococcus sp. Marseille-P5729 TaxID=2086582 RepID=UPI000D0F6D3E|nr:magnesium transporter CorA family protein [Blastococcus sp. Marseille-P5729]
MAEQDAVVTCQVWRNGAVATERIPLERISDELANPGSMVWIDLVRPSRSDLEKLAAAVGLDDAALEDATAPRERPKVTRHAHHLFFMTYATRLVDQPLDAADNHGRLRLSRVSGFLMDGGLITVRLDDDFDMSPVLRAWEENYDLLVHGSGALMHGLLDVIVDGHFETIQQLDDGIEDLEDTLFEERHTGRAFQRSIYGLRKDLVQLRRVVLPMREVVNTLLRHRKTGNSALDPLYDDLYDHVLRAAEWTESLRDMVTTVFETNLSLQDAHLNVVMKKLAGWAAIIAVPTAVTGWFGQNLPYPGFSNNFGLVQSVVLILALSIGLYALLRSRDWI